MHDTICLVLLCFLMSMTKGDIVDFVVIDVKMRMGVAGAGRC